MKVTIELTKKTALEEIINSNDIDTIKSLIERKEMSLKEAEENAAFYESICNEEYKHVHVGICRTSHLHGIL